MPFAEIFASGAPEQRTRLICAQLVADLMEGEGGLDNSAAGVISGLVWQEASAWSIRGQPVSPAEAPCYLIRISIPEGALTEQRMPRSFAAAPLYSPPPDQPARFTSASRRCRSSRSRRARGGHLTGRCRSPDHRLRHHRRPCPS
jgi:hypothetical protein